MPIAPRLTTNDTLAIEMSARTSEALTAILASVEGKRLPSEREMEIALTARAELNRRLARLAAGNGLG